jgi:energy-coupling factor transporter ATP-binding protein EcfA2
MQLAKVVIEDFRQFRYKELDFTDALDRVRPLSLLVGPNTCGKTTILDAIAAALSPTLELPCTRPGFRLHPRTVVRRGALHATVTCRLRFSEDEITAAQELSRLAELRGEVPDERQVTLTWRYPDPHHRTAGFGFTRCEPKAAWRLLKGRVTAARLLSTQRVTRDWFKRVPGVFTFDQQRTGMDKIIPRMIWNLIHGLGDGDSAETAERRTSDPGTILLSLAMQARLATAGSAVSRDFGLIQETYARICAPHRIGGVVLDDLGIFFLQFNDGHNDYGYEGLSSGEQMLLLFLIRMVTESIHRSIILIDELELHQHPIWQAKLLHLLPQIGEANQLIVTTHSPYLRDLVARDAVEDLGTLQDRPVQEASV